MSKHPTRDAVAALIAEGLTKNEISRRLGVSRSTVRRWADRISAEQDIALETAEGDEVLSFLQQLAPIQLSPKNDWLSDSKSLERGYTAVIGDTHFGQECEKTLKVFYDVLDDLKPGKVVLNGDTLDMLAVSRYPKDARYDVSLVEERKRYHAFIETIRLILGKDVQIIETNANHSGNGVEGRWWRFLSERLGPVASLPEVLEALSYDKVFLPSWQKIEMVDHTIVGGLVVMHGDVVRSKGAASARGMMDKWYASLLMNHTHRFGMTAQRIPALGMRTEQQLFAYENACACSLNPCYTTAANWQNGFSLIGETADGLSFGIEQVQVVNGKAISTTTGKSYKA